MFSKKRISISVSGLITAILLLAIGSVGGYTLAVYGAAYGLKLPFIGTPETVYQLTESGTPQRYQSISFDLFWTVWELLERRYLEPNDISAAKMVEGAIGGMVSALGDPYTAYIPPEPNRISEQNLAGAFYGIGIELGYKDKMVAVVAPLKDMPAERAGVQPWDVITHVKDEKAGVDEDCYDWTLEKAMSVLRGEAGSTVEVTFFRENYNDNVPFTLTFTREEVTIDSVVVEFEEREGQTVAYLGLGRFGERTSEEWNAAVTQIAARRNEIKGVVLDMRGNPGGLFTEAVHIASEFIKDGVIVTDQGRSTKNVYQATGTGRLIGVPLVVLVNGGSASASEIVAGALRDRLGTKIVGTTTFGKGLVQQRFEMENGAGLNVTIAKWVMPSGGWLDNEGLAPDVEITDHYDPTTDTDAVLEEGIKQLLQ